MKEQFALILKDKDKTNKLEEENMNLKKELKKILMILKIILIIQL
jgi:hypothetical protein